MNLVEAIRMASQKQADVMESRSMPILPNETPAPTSEPSSSADDTPPMQTVRFEVRLTEQQLQDLLHWLARSLHPVMTLREAAHYLRLRPNEVQALAERGEIPAFKMDNRWRFLKNALDEWLTAQRVSESANKEENDDAA